MKQYLVKITPQEPYFFGNERSFKFPGDENSGQVNSKYYAKSEKTPAGSTIMGMLRYVLLPVKKTDFSKYTDEDKRKNAVAVGPESFCFGKEGQNFGLIKEISPLFIINGEDFLVPAPFYHKYGEKTYSPFREYKAVKTPDGEYLYTGEYNSKNGVFSGYMRLSDGKIFEDNDIFLFESRNGRNSFMKEDVFFRRQYVGMKPGFSFGVYATLEDGAAPENTVVFMGQKKSVFSVSFIPQGNTITEKIGRLLNPGEIYCFGDSFIKRDIYKDMLFAVVKTREYRGFSTNYGKVKKEETLYRTVAAGSIFIPKPGIDAAAIFENPDARTAGYNIVVSKPEDEQ
ncbi:MAG: hypothetical protein IKB92_02175 [Clostridia bacterium]|nr:hypothetical protein [Clostridia bacterium]